VTTRRKRAAVFGVKWMELWRHFLYPQRSGSGFDSTTIRESFYWKLCCYKTWQLFSAVSPKIASAP